ncbi:MAG TPA: DHH family phosphoesterase [Candidatus Acidoferrum sp.]|nr:DHH family phosphoesterase [Candidatus Acidoferrum sp.]
MKKSKPRSVRVPALSLLAAVVFAVTAVVDYRYALAQLVMAAILLSGYAAMGVTRRTRRSRALAAVGARLETGSVGFMTTAMPAAAVDKTGTVVWYNPAFEEMVGKNCDIGHDIKELVEGLDMHKYTAEDLMTGIDMTACGRSLRVYASLLREQGEDKEALLVLLFVDMTTYRMLEREHEASRPVAALISIDNLDEITQDATESEKALVLGAVDNLLREWAKPTGGLIQLYERGRYVFVFEDRFLSGYIAEKFAVLDRVRETTGPGGASPTISIGIGRGEDSYEDAMELARQALEMALGRGGDQAAVKQGTDFEFFGGKSKAVERRTKVKSRVMAAALSDLLDKATSVIIMGHRAADFDAVGASVGVARLAMARKKPVNIVINRGATPAIGLIEHIEMLPEYEGIFVDPIVGLDRITSGTLLVICDTHNPDYIESKEIYEAAEKVVVIDHHRRMAKAIENTALTYHEPYASSTSEIVCELAQYIEGGAAMRKREAEALLAGIVLDTNTFFFKTSFRTFEAAGFLRKLGADTIEVKKLFQIDQDSYHCRTELVGATKLIERALAVAAWEGELMPDMGVIAAQAADEMLGLDGVEASFVLYGSDGEVNISARSLGKLNVQLIMEDMGGGGHLTNAGAQVSGELAGVRDQLIEAARRHLHEVQK